MKGECIIEVSDAHHYQNYWYQMVEFDILDEEAPSVESLAISAGLSADEVKAGQPITAEWAITGGQAPYTVHTYWRIITEYSQNEHFIHSNATTGTDSFIPRYGEGGSLYIWVEDAVGRTDSQYYSFDITDETPSAKPFTVELSLNNREVKKGDPVTASWEIRGGTLPYSITRVDWSIYEDRDSHRIDAKYTHESRSVSLTPHFGDRGYMNIEVRDAKGRTADASVHFNIIGEDTETLSCGIELSEGSVQVGQEISARWAFSGGLSPQVDKASWVIVDSNLKKTYIPAEVGAEAIITLTPGFGSYGYLELRVSDETGYSRDILSKGFKILGADPASPLTGSVTLDRPDVDAEKGESVTASWAFSGGKEPYTTECHWVIDENGIEHLISADTNADTASLTPKFGQYVYMKVSVTDEDGRRQDFNSGRAAIQNGNEAAPISVSVSTAASSVKAGEDITGNWTISGGKTPYTVSFAWATRGEGGAWSESEWEPADNAAGSVSFKPKNGQVKGYLRIKVTDADERQAIGKSTYFDIIPVSPVRFELNAEEKTLAAGEGFQLIASLEPADAAVGSVSWESSDPGIATVTAEGYVQAVGLGTARITARVATEEGGEVEASCEVRVKRLVETVTFPQNFEELTVGAERQLMAMVLPENADDPSLVWASSDTGVAKVDEHGLVTGLSSGSATITATARDGSGKSASCEVQVRQRIETLTLSHSYEELNVGDKLPLTATVLPANADNQSLVWTSSDTDVAEVDEYGLVTAKSPGAATITATVQDGSGVSAECSVVVKKPELIITINMPKEVELGKPITATWGVSGGTGNYSYDYEWSVAIGDAYFSMESAFNQINNEATFIPTDGHEGEFLLTVRDSTGAEVYQSALFSITDRPAKFTLNAAEKFLLAKKTFALKGTLTPASAAEGKITWKSSSTAVATVSASGLVTAKKTGTATITATVKLKNGKTMTAKSVIYVQTGKLSLNQTVKTLLIGKTFTLIGTTSPSGAAKGKATWKSSNTAVASVSASGVVKGIKAGTATITASVNINGGGTATAKSTIYVAGFSLNATVKSIMVNKSFTLKSTLTPSGAAAGKVSWKSSNPAVATVSASGAVKGIKAGTATITATIALKGGGTATAKSTIYVAGFSLNATEKTLTVGKSFTLKGTLTPSGAANGKVTWKSNDSKIATVSASGALKGIKAGTATITATIALKGGGTATAKCKVYIISGLKLNTTTKTLLVGKTHVLKGTLNPATAGAGKIIWKSSKGAVASVDETGRVTANGAGTATITATVALKGGGTATAKCAVTVTEFMLNASTTSVQVKKTYALKGTLAPSLVAGKPITWKSSNSKIATVSAAGVVKGIKAGKATITATVKLADGRTVTAACAVTVK